MAGYLIAEEGPLVGLILSFTEGEEWSLGRDPTTATLCLEDPKISRLHAVCRLTSEGYLFENLSSANPSLRNGLLMTEPTLLHEGDILQIGDTFFRFAEHLQQEWKGALPLPPIPEENRHPGTLTFPSSSRWMIKVLSGPSKGAEFQLQKSAFYIFGQDPTVCDIIFLDASVSNQHLRLHVDADDKIFLEDLKSLNGTLVNGERITETRQIFAQDLLSFGSTLLYLIDREQMRNTIAEKDLIFPQIPPQKIVKRDWKESLIPKKYLVLGGLLGVFLIISLVGILSLFKTVPIVLHEKKEQERIEFITKEYPAIRFSYNAGTGKLFLTGHVLTSTQYQELLYKLKSLSFLDEKIEDMVVIDELVWANMNALLLINPAWQGISIHSSQPGRFVIQGYLQSLEQAQALSDYLNIHFPYQDRLENQVIIESLLMAEIESALLEKGFNNVTYLLSNGDLILSGRIDGKGAGKFGDLVKEFKGLKGIRSLKNFVLHTTEESSLVDLSSKYKVMGYSKKDGASLYVVIGGKILSVGDPVDDMIITAIHANVVLLEKDGLKFKINYNLQ